MKRRGRPVALTVFWIVCALAAAQVVWWVVFLVQHAADRRHVVMFLSEGVAFMIVTLVGVVIIYGSLSEQVRTRQLRATFLAAVTHELRSPLASIRLLLETLHKRCDLDPAKRHELIGRMLADTDRLERLVQDLLRAGQLENHALEAAPVRLDLVELVRERIEAIRERLLQPADGVEASLDGEVIVAVDPELFRGVIDNLLENAVKYSETPRRLDVRVFARRGVAVLEVQDDGIGLDPETQAQLFRPFYRAGDEETRSQRGTGLGLYLVAGIALAHGGRCAAESDGVGRGTTMRVEVPLARVPDAGGASRAGSPSPPPGSEPQGGDP